MMFYIIYPPILYMFAIQIILNLISRSMSRTQWLKPIYIWSFSFIGLYMINRGLIPDALPSGEYRCGMFMYSIIILTAYGIIGNSIIYLGFSKWGLEHKGTS